MNILLTGGTGLVGRHLIKRLRALGHEITVVTRNREAALKALGPEVTLWSSLDNHDSLDGFQAVINLAGEPIADKRWTESQKRRLCQSRWEITQRLVTLFKASRTPPAMFISGSAVGYYGNLGDVVVTEGEPARDEFTHQLCARWEQIACEARSDHTRVCLLRTGAVLAHDGGMLAKLMPLYRLGLGGPLGNGRQYLAWIHIEDMVSAIVWLLHHELSGPFNMVAPYPVHNEQFSHALGKALHRPAILRAPACAVKAMMGESAVLVLGGQRALPQRLEESGFHFQWHDIDQALRNIAQQQACT